MKQDLYCGVILVAIGTAAVLEGFRHRIGTLTEMQAGYFPVALGVMLIVLGVATALLAWRGPKRASTFFKPDWRGCGAIIAGMVAFIAMGAWFGLAPATFFCVFLAALGDRTTSWRGALGLATVMTVFTIGLFSFLLQVQFPILSWPT